jgi:hypothetical protein
VRAALAGASRSAARTAVFVLLAGAAACSTVTLFVPPAGPGTAAPEGERALADAVEACRDVTSITAIMRLRGRLGDRRVPSVTLRGAATIDGHVRLLLSAAGSTRFVVSGRGGTATLYLHDDNRTLTAPAGDIVEALMGMRIGPVRLLRVLSGCITTDPAYRSAERLGDLLRVQTADAQLFLASAGGRWQTIWGRFDELNVEYRGYASGAPTQVLLGTDATHDPRVQLQLTIDERTINETLAPEAFDYRPPPGATPMTLEELKQAGPLGRQKR